MTPVRAKNLQKLHMYYIMYNMKTTTLRELRHHFGRILHWIEDGQEVEITKRRRVIAKLLPVDAKAEKLHWPDFEARLRKTFPNGLKGRLLSEVIDEQRGERP